MNATRNGTNPNFVGDKDVEIQYLRQLLDVWQNNDADLQRKIKILETSLSEVNKRIEKQYVELNERDQERNQFKNQIEGLKKELSKAKKNASELRSGILSEAGSKGALVRWQNELHKRTVKTQEENRALRKDNKALRDLLRRIEQPID